MIRAGLISLLALTACAPVSGKQAEAFNPTYHGVQTSLLEGDLVQFHVSMSGARTSADVDDYGECAAAQYALIRGYGFARHVRTKMKQQGGMQMADAVYTISPSLPRGLRTIDAQVVVANCAANGIPTV